MLAPLPLQRLCSCPPSPYLSMVEHTSPTDKNISPLLSFILLVPTYGAAPHSAEPSPGACKPGTLVQEDPPVPLPDQLLVSWASSLCCTLCMQPTHPRTGDLQGWTQAGERGSGQQPPDPAKSAAELQTKDQAG